MLGFYRSTSALQVKYMPSIYKTTDKGFKVLEKAGGLLLEGTLGKDRVYDWDKKINFSIAMNDIPIIYNAKLEFMNSQNIDLELVHDTNAQTDKAGQLIKKLTIKNGQPVTKAGKTYKTYMLSMSTIENKKATNNTYCSLTAGELLMFFELITSVLSDICGFKGLMNT